MRKKIRKKRRKLTLYLIGIFIGTFILSYKGYECYHNKIVQANKEVTASKVVSTNKAKESDIKIETKENMIVNRSHNINDEGQKYTYDVKRVKDILDNKEESDGKKIAFLTFDDGPSTTVTPKILDVLKEHNVKATFFLIGKSINSNEASKNLVKRTFREGHALGNHTYSHNLKSLYPENKINVDCFVEEVVKTNAAIKNIIGQDFDTRVLRMPGGYMSREHYKDPNLAELNNRLRDMYSIDWNAYDFDSEGKKKNAEELLKEVKKSVGTKEKVVILMHDAYGKEETAKALPQIIKYLRDQGYEFKTLS
ncbi:polysaccharide deacetylase family protein [Clostridium sp. OS1-26]|uniref:polysaccharide deacetylase family protein n=1 Tax=Clostridium sp. OS1-26 TaxID=3070681 RepID=UPI0027E0E779|nr:polysaccharide deacetylase family protein [Clostridium sp. OS1-26]WML33505.1 polysaccharide deacetylase family protein [Clostridium sp. OS1-26]